MKTVKWLKISIILQSIFAFFCIASSLCFAINRYFDLRSFFILGDVFIFGWIINPIGLISVIVGLIMFFCERDDVENRKIIGNRWVWFVLFFVVDVLMYLTAAILTVALTGGV